MIADRNVAYTSAVASYLSQLIEFDIWATASLLDFLESQPTSLMDATTPGVYGSTCETLSHMLFAERSNVERLSGRRPGWPDAPSLGLPQIRELARAVHQSLMELSPGLPDPDRRYKRTLGWMTAATNFAQLIQHGCEHRAQVGAILGALGVPPPNLDAQAHGIAIGAASLAD